MFGVQRLGVFFLAYGIFLLFAYRLDPRFSLRYKKPPSFSYLIWISTLETAVLIFILISLNFLLDQDLIAIFGLNRLLFSEQEVLLGLLGGATIFLICLPINLLVSVLRRKFFPSYKSQREEKVKNLVFASLPKSRSLSFALLSLVSLKAAVFEEIIFRGYLLSNFLLLTFPTLAILLQALLFFIPHLYQGIFNAVLPLVGGFLFGLIFFLTGSLTVVIIAHFTGDLIGLSIQAVSIKGSK